MAKTIRCDRCGFRAEKYPEVFNCTEVALKAQNNKVCYNFDLCEACTNSVVSFIRWPKEGMEWLNDKLAQQGMRDHLAHVVAEKLDRDPKK